MNTFAGLIAHLGEKVDIDCVDIKGGEFCRVARFVLKKDRCPRYLYWRGADPDPAEFGELAAELMAHLDLGGE